MPIAWGRKDLLSLEELNKEELGLILATAESFKEVSTREIKKVPALRGKTVVNLFYEPSTRTRLSFESAVNQLGGRIIGFSDTGTTSVTKGETLKDTIKMVRKLQPNMMIRRRAIGPWGDYFTPEGVNPSMQ